MALQTEVKKEIVLKVQDPDPSHVGRNIVTLDRQSKNLLGVTSGDIIEIQGSKKTAAIIWPARQEDEGMGIIRMDNLIRHNAGISLGEKVLARKAEFKESKKVILAPTQEVRIIASGYDRILKKSFIGRPLTKGDNVWISVFGSGFIYTVVDTNPRGIVKVTDFTQFVLKEEPVKEALEGVPKIAYEDIGGLDEQVKKVREMIELPMKHPELFRKLGINPPKGVLLHGPPGTGKTLLAKAVANETQAHFISVNAPEVMCVSGETPILLANNKFKSIEKMFAESLQSEKLINDGRLKIIELTKPINICSIDSNLKISEGKVTHITKLKAKTFKVKTSLNDEIIVSSNQPFALIKNGSIIWKIASNLRKGELVAVANILQVENNSSTKLFNSQISLCEIIEITEGEEKELFDLTVEPFNNFLAGNSLMILHNSKFVGEAEERIRQMFKEAEENAPSIIFIDEIDAIAPKREEVVGEVERRVVAQLLALMDGMEARGNVIVISATNRVNSLDEALRRPGRFDREIEIGVPDKKGRKDIMQIHTRGMPLAKDIELEYFANITHGFVGADLEALAKEAAMKALRRYLPKINLEEEEIPPEVLEDLEVNRRDFSDALKEVQPSALREVMVEVPNVKWSEIGGLELAKQELKQAVEWPIKDPIAFKKMGIRPPKGILLYGPPGTGKTLLAKAVATESEANFISIKGPELISKWIGDSEKGVRKIFRRARQVSPVIVFFDEIDSIASARGSIGDSGVTERVVNQLLTELDGIEDIKDVVFIAATNRPDLVDSSLLRPGRIDKMILVLSPDEATRHSIFKIHTKNVPIAKDVDLKELAAKTEGYSGADIEGLVREAALIAMQESKMKAVEVNKNHFVKAMQKILPSITKDVLDAYAQFRENYSSFKPKYVD